MLPRAARADGNYSENNKCKLRKQKQIARRIRVKLPLSPLPTHVVTEQLRVREDAAWNFAIKVKADAESEAKYFTTLRVIIPCRRGKVDTWGRLLVNFIRDVVKSFCNSVTRG